MLNFNRSFYPVRILRSDQDCCLKFHFHGAAREVVGLIERKAALDPEHFLYWSVDAIVKRCRRYQGAAYNKRVVEYILAFLRQNHIISRPLKRERWIGAHVREVTGFIVSAHDALAIRTGNECGFVGMLRAPGRWEAIPGLPTSIWWKPWPNAVARAKHSSESQGADAGADVGADSGADVGADETAKRCGRGCGPKTSKGADKGADKSADAAACKSRFDLVLHDDE